MRKKQKQFQFGWVMIGCGLLAGWIFFRSLHIVSLQNRVKGETTTLSASEIISITNAVRQSNGIKPLQPQLQLTAAAEAKANAMMTADSWDHNTPTQTPWSFLDQEEYIYVEAGENLAKGFDSAVDVVDGWLNSPSHRENLMNPTYTETGVAVVKGTFQGKQNVYLVVQFLAYPLNLEAEMLVEPQLFQPPMLIKEVGNMNPIVFLSMFTGFTILCTSLMMAVRWKLRKQPKLINSLHWKK